MPDQDEPTTAPPAAPTEAADRRAALEETAGMWKDVPPAAVRPPTIDPAKWEDFPTFRESLLRHCTGPEANGAMRAFGMLLHEMVLEWNGTQPDEPEGYIRHDVRAALADLRAVQGFLGQPVPLAWRLGYFKVQLENGEELVRATCRPRSPASGAGATGRLPTASTSTASSTCLQAASWRRYGATRR